MKIGFLITARLKSSRLPLKLLLDLKGKTMVERVIDRTKEVGYIDDIVLCTSTNSQDLPLAQIARKNDIYYFLGSEEDVFQRLTNAASFWGFDYVVNITGENPLFSIEYANRVADELRTGKYDFVHIEGLPLGCAVYGLRAKAMEVVCSIKETIDTEIWGLLINQPEVFSVKSIQAEEQHCLDMRITSDYWEDYELIKAIYAHFPADATPSYLDVLEVLRNHSSLKQINANRVQAQVPKEVVEKINSFYKNNLERIKKIKGEVYG